MLQKTSWADLVLTFADGSGLISRWRGDHAEQGGGRRQMTGDTATAEHLRALHELRSVGGCTNWFASTDEHPEQRLTDTDVDWTGLPDHHDGDLDA